MAQMMSYLPARKVVASSLSVAGLTLVLWVLERFVLHTALPVAVSGTALAAAAFLAGYLVLPSLHDQVRPSGNRLPFAPATRPTNFGWELPS